MDSVPWPDYKNGEWLKRKHPELASAIAELPWIQDGIEDGVESSALQYLLNAAAFGVPAVESVIVLDWARDSITDLEKEAFRWLRNMSADSAVAVVAMPWLQDGLTDQEVQMMRRLSYFDQGEDGEIVIRFLAMPFLETIEASV